ncbi:hypothetical protein NDU88_006144 [Pleurodeles waltl]|uniref:Uncharacterized protein n=1 Tax=Pleurodeles waltl TaxID=8319 RepID=A0AAV7X0N1_PLEWA|nr:hypothetical protein NDU88_006144 [Pleurodeles waltl]
MATIVGDTFASPGTTAVTIVSAATIATVTSADTATAPTLAIGTVSDSASAEGGKHVEGMLGSEEPVSIMCMDQLNDDLTPKGTATGTEELPDVVTVRSIIEVR